MSMFESVWTFQISYVIYFAEFMCIVAWIALSLELEVSALYED
jgi:hypothetical protein